MSGSELDLDGIEKWSAVIGNINKLSPNVNVTQLLEVTGTLVARVRELEAGLAEAKRTQVKNGGRGQLRPFPDEAEG